MLHRQGAALLCILKIGYHSKVALLSQGARAARPAMPRGQSFRQRKVITVAQQLPNSITHLSPCPASIYLHHSITPTLVSSTVQPWL